MRRSRAPSFKTEVELAAALVHWLGTAGWEVYQEVLLEGRVCDVVATKGEKVWALETKLRFGAAVVDQAARWRGSASLVSVVTCPARSTSTALVQYLNWKGIGWQTFRPSLTPGVPYQMGDRSVPLIDRGAGAELKAALKPAHKTAVGAGGNRGGHLTPFKETCARVLALVKERPGLEVREVVDLLWPLHYKTKASARAGISHWAQKGKVPGVGVQAGRLYEGRYLGQ